MKKQDVVLNASLLTSSFLLILLLTGCAQAPQSCPPQPPADLSGAIAFAEDDQLDFRFPLDELGENKTEYNHRYKRPKRKYHCSPN